MNNISVIIPNFNHGHYLAELLPSLFVQRRPPDEVVVVDDGSTDDSVAIVRQFASIEPRVKLVLHDRNRGVIQALNRALEASTGDLVCFPSADNLILDGFFETCLESLNQFPDAVMCASDLAYLESQTGEILLHPLGLSDQVRVFSPADTMNLFLNRQFSVGSLGHTIMVKRVALQEWAFDGNFFDPGLQHLADFFVWQAIALTRGFVFIPQVLAAFRTGEPSYSLRHRTRSEMWGVYGHLCRRLGATGNRDLGRRFADSHALGLLGRKFQAYLLWHPENWWLFRISLIWQRLIAPLKAKESFARQVQ